MCLFGSLSFCNKENLVSCWWQSLWAMRHANVSLLSLREKYGWKACENQKMQSWVGRPSRVQVRTTSGDECNLATDVFFLCPMLPDGVIRESKSVVAMCLKCPINIIIRSHTFWKSLTGKICSSTMVISTWAFFKLYRFLIKSKWCADSIPPFLSSTI